MLPLLFPILLRAQDSSRVRELEAEIAIAQLRVEATRFWRRILPSVHFTASLGMRDAIIYDPMTVLLPRDSYRLTLSIPLHEMLRSEEHDEATIRLRRLREEREEACRACARIQDEHDRGETLRRDELRLMRGELRVLEEILQYHELLYREGKTTFDLLARSRLQVLQTERQILHLQRPTREGSSP
jgi:outer membrane protein TolC